MVSIVLKITKVMMVIVNKKKVFILDNKEVLRDI